MSATSHESLAALSGSFLGLSTLVVALRYFTRRRQKAELGVDDWLMVPCLALFIGWMAVVFVGIHNHVLGYPQPKDPKVLIASQKLAVELYMSINILSTATFGLIKLSALFFYIRIFSPNRMRTTFKTITIITAVVVALWASAFIILLPLQCGSHFSMLWSPNKVVRANYCWRADTELQAWVISDVMLDAWIICLPLPKIWNLSMSLRRKLAITSIFMLAFVGWAASIARMVIYIKAVLDIKAGRKGHSSRDTNSEVIWYGVLSGGMCLIAVNLPSISFLINKSSPAPEKVLRSVRSILSLRSTRSSTFSKKGSSDSKRGYYSKDSASSDEGRPSFQGKLRPDAGAYEVYALRDLDVEKGEDVPPVPPIGNIRVKDTVSQTAERK